MVSRAQNEKEGKQWFQQGIQERGTQESNMKLWNYRETSLQQFEDNTTISPVLTLLWVAHKASDHHLLHE